MEKEAIDTKLIIQSNPNQCENHFYHDNFYGKTNMAIATA